MPDGIGIDENIHSLWVWRVCIDQQYYILCSSLHHPLKSFITVVSILYVYIGCLCLWICVFVY